MVYGGSCCWNWLVFTEVLTKSYHFGMQMLKARLLKQILMGKMLLLVSSLFGCSQSYCPRAGISWSTHDGSLFAWSKCWLTQRQETTLGPSTIITGKRDYVLSSHYLKYVLS